MEEVMLNIDNVSKMYKLGQIGGTTLRDELQRRHAKLRGKEDPTRKIGAREYTAGETFMALNGVSFKVNKGERVGIIGHNGAGKSTLLKLISRVTAPTGGKIQMNGRVASMLEVGTGFHPELTGRENIYMNGAILGMTRKEIDAKIENIIDFSEVRQFIDTPVKRYSSGMYVKLAFSVAAHLDADIMIMDEVLAVGDMKFQEKCIGKMNDVSKSEGRTILYVSHNMNTIRQLCDRVVVLDHGRVLFDGDVEKGIEIYLKALPLSDNNIEDLGKNKRAKQFVNDIVTIEQFEVKTENSVFQTGDKLHAALKVYSAEQLENVRFEIPLRSVSGVSVTRFLTKPQITLNASQVNIIRFTIDISEIAPGRYTLGLILRQVNSFGAKRDLDGVDNAYSFEIVAASGFNDGTEWNKAWSGYYVAPMIELEESQ